jgi:glycogen(starch) synthase
LVPTIAVRSSVIHNGLEIPVLAPTPLQFDSPRLLCLGRLSREKGFDLALAAVKILKQEFPEIRLVLAGDGPMRTDLEQRAREFGIRDHVDFLGWVAPGDVPSLINTVTVVLMPSRQESLPLAALEAALMARPLVAARVGGLPEVVIDEATGLLVEPFFSCGSKVAVTGGSRVGCGRGWCRE